MHTTNLSRWYCKLKTLTFSRIPDPMLGEMAQNLSRYYCTLKSVLQKLTCPEPLQRAQFEDRRPRDCSHKHVELQNVAVAFVWGSSKKGTCLHNIPKTRFSVCVPSFMLSW